MYYTIILIFIRVLVATNNIDLRDYALSESTKENNTKLIENIRRQLTKDNYDYELTSDNEETLNSRKDNTNIDKDDGDNKENNSKTQEQDGEGNYHDLDHKKVGKITETPKKGLIMRANGPKLSDDGISKNDLLYYIDDEKLKLKTEATTPKYKVLTLKPAHANRRSNTIRRVIQEETPDGISILTLDDEPLPLFQLPKTRRQYMEHHGTVDSEEELVPGFNE